MTRERLEWLAASEDCRDRQNTAGDTGCPPELLVKLAQDANRYVRVTVVENPNTPPETLKVLAGDEHRVVRFLVAENPNTPPKTLKVLAGDGNGFVRSKVAKNPACPPELLDHLAQDEDEDVRIAAREQLKQREQRRRESACADYAAELDAGSMGYGDGL